MVSWQCEAHLLGDFWMSAWERASHRSRSPRAEPCRRLRRTRWTPAPVEAPPRARQGRTCGVGKRIEAALSRIGPTRCLQDQAQPAAVRGQVPVNATPEQTLIATATAQYSARTDLPSQALIRFIAFDAALITGIHQTGRALGVKKLLVAFVAARDSKTHHAGNRVEVCRFIAGQAGIDGGGRYEWRPRRIVTIKLLGDGDDRGRVQTAESCVTVGQSRSSRTSTA